MLPSELVASWAVAANKTAKGTAPLRMFWIVTHSAIVDFPAPPARYCLVAGIHGGVLDRANHLDMMTLEWIGEDVRKIPAEPFERVGFQLLPPARGSSGLGIRRALPTSRASRLRSRSRAQELFDPASRVASAGGKPPGLIE